MPDEKDKTYCYLDHANKKSENYAANPYLFWLNQVRRQRSDQRTPQQDDGNDEDAPIARLRTGGC